MQRRTYIGVPPAYTGVVFLLSWIYLLFYANTAGIETAAPITLMSAGYTVSALCMVAVLFLVAFLPIDRIKFLTRASVKIVTPIAMAFGSAALIVGGTDMPTILWTGAILTGICSGIMAQQWIMVYRRVGLGAAIGSFPTLMAMSVGICVTLMYLPDIVLLIATVVFPLVSEALLHRVRKDPWPYDDISQDPRNNPLNFVLLLLPFAVYSVASGFLDYFSFESNYTFVFYALVAFIPLIVSGISLFRIDRSCFLPTFIIPVCFLIMAFIPFLSLHDVTPMSQFISIGELGIEVLSFIVIIGFTEFFSIDAFKTYAFGRMVLTVFNAIGWYIASCAGSAYGTLWNSQVSLIAIFVGVEVFAICLIVAIVKAQKDVSPARQIEGDQVSQSKFVLESENGGAKPRAAVASDVLERQCAEIARRYELSKREEDVLNLLARGYTSARIQSELYIAPGTVNYHTRNIYAKLSIHSKQELIDLAGSTAIK